MRNWYEIKAKADGNAEIFLYDEIGGWGVGAKQFIDELRTLEGSQITLRIHSPGGAVLDGHAIYNALKRHDGGVVTAIDGLAASMASVIAMAGERVSMAKNGFLMIHNPSGVAMGEGADLRKTADLLDKMKDGLVNIYVQKTKMPAKKIEDMMDEETWMTASEAMEMGFIDEVTDEIDIAAKFDLSKFAHLPRALVDNKKQSMANQTLLEIPIDELNQLRRDSASLVSATGSITALTAENEAFKTRISDLALANAAFISEVATLKAKIATLEATAAAEPQRLNEQVQRTLAATGHPAPVAEGRQGTSATAPETWSVKLAKLTPAERAVAMKLHRQEIFAEYRSPKQQQAVLR